MSAADEKVERGADKLEELSRRAARAGGVKAKLAEPLAEDAEFLRKLKPSLIAARARGEAPTDGEPTQVVPPQPAAPHGSKPHKPSGGAGPSPFVVFGAMLVLGIVLAHVVDWLGSRYPRS
jgi:hypothetical protein